MGVNELVKILEQVHEPDEYQLVSHDLNHPLYYVWKLENIKMKDLNINLREFRKEHSRFDIFINGQYILERDYITEHKGNVFFVKFLKSNFSFELTSSDDVVAEGDLETV
tara:strand:+ start:198 stop:527 length:330 start_codon:yes stop_codon:yes gene_type:complete